MIGTELRTTVGKGCNLTHLRTRSLVVSVLGATLDAASSGGRFTYLYYWRHGRADARSKPDQALTRPVRDINHETRTSELDRMCCKIDPSSG